MTTARAKAAKPTAAQEEGSLSGRIVLSTIRTPMTAATIVMAWNGKGSGIRRKAPPNASAISAMPRNGSQRSVGRGASSIPPSSYHQLPFLSEEVGGRGLLRRDVHDGPVGKHRDVA